MSYRLTTDKSWAATYRELGTQFQRWAALRGGRINWAVENLRGKRAVTLRYTLPDEPEVVLTMERQGDAESNLRVLYLAIESLRLNEVRGISELVREAYLALPAPTLARDPYEVLGVRPDSPLEVIEAAYKALAKVRHPDAGGSDAAMAELNDAYARVKVR